MMSTENKPEKDAKADKKEKKVEAPKKKAASAETMEAVLKYVIGRMSPSEQADIKELFPDF